MGRIVIIRYICTTIQGGGALGGPTIVINGVMGPLEMAENQWVSLGLFHREISGVITTLLGYYLGVPGAYLGNWPLIRLDHLLAGGFNPSFWFMLVFGSVIVCNKYRGTIYLGKTN